MLNAVRSGDRPAALSIHKQSAA